MIGVSFQPGGERYGQQSNGGQSGAPASNVQEAIKILSLRLPKVVGAQAVSPQALLASQGSGGNPRVDSVVNSVLARMFPTGQAPTQAPMVPQGQPSNAPTFSGGNVSGPRMAPSSSENPWESILESFGGGQKPRVTVGNPPIAPFTGGAPKPNTATPDSPGGGSYDFPGLIAPLPPMPPTWPPVSPQEREDVPLI